MLIIVKAHDRLSNGTTSLSHTYEELFFKFAMPKKKKQTDLTANDGTKSIIVWQTVLRKSPAITDVLRPNLSGKGAKKPVIRVPTKYIVSIMLTVASGVHIKSISVYHVSR